MSTKKFTGTGVALITPFTPSGESVDIEALERLVEFVIDGGVDYIVVLGTTGESATCSLQEKREILQTVLKVNNGRKPIVLGIGGNNTKAVIETFDAFDFTGVDAILSASPYYNKPSQEGIYQHYKAIADASPKPIILYNVPGRTSSNVSAETTIRLASHPNIVAIKEASGDLEQCMRIMRDKPDDFMLLSGDDMLTTSMVSFGAEGVISVLANAFPKEFSGMVTKALDGKFNEASSWLTRFINTNQLMYVESNPVGVKASLEIKGVINGMVRLPLLKASNELVEKLKIAMKEIES